MSDGIKRDIEIIESQDYSHPYTTAVEHVKELYDVAVTTNSKLIVELGSYKGISTVALALAAIVNDGIVTSVDLCDEISNEERLDYWESIQKGLSNSIYTAECTSSEWLNAGYINHNDDMIFHDAAHGDQVVPEYYLAWERVKKVLIIHDFEQISKRKEFIENIQPKSWYSTLDSRGRELAVFFKQ